MNEPKLPRNFSSQILSGELWKGSNGGWLKGPMWPASISTWKFECTTWGCCWTSLALFASSENVGPSWPSLNLHGSRWQGILLLHVDIVRRWDGTPNDLGLLVRLGRSYLADSVDDFVGLHGRNTGCLARQVGHVWSYLHMPPAAQDFLCVWKVAQYPTGMDLPFGIWVVCNV